MTTMPDLPLFAYLIEKMSETIDVGQISVKNTCFFEIFFEKACGVREKALPLHSLHSKKM